MMWLEILLLTNLIAITSGLLFIGNRNFFRKQVPTDNYYLRDVLSALDSFVCVLAADGTVLEVNAAASSVIGIPRQQIIGLRFWDAKWWNYSEESMTNMRSVSQSVADGASVRKEFKYQDAKGLIRHMDFSMTPLRDKNGIITHLVASGVDNEAQKIFETELINARTEAEIANRAKSAFLAHISHELRSPLGVILGFAELAKKESDSQQKNQHIITIDRNAHQLLALVDEILDLAKVEAGGVSIDIEDVDIKKMIDDLSTSLSLKAQERGLELKFEIAPNTPPWIRTDPLRLKQILLNVVGNAIKYTPKGQVQCIIRRLPPSANQSATIIFDVQDTGIGIDPEDVKRLFQPFARGIEGEQKKYKGTGLGLVLSRRLAQILGGDIKLIDSKPGVGSRFEVTISEQRAVDGDIAKMGKHVLGFEEESEVSGRLSGMRLLVVDDVADNRILISKILEQEGAKVNTAAGGKEAIVMSLEDGFHAVLMDLSMPVISGQEATLELRKKGYKIPIIALTAHAMREEKEKALREGFNYYFTKPIIREVLIGALAGIFRSYEEPIRENWSEDTQPQLTKNTQGSGEIMTIDRG